MMANVEIESLTQRAMAATFGTAILVVVTLTTVPFEQLDAHLVNAVHRFSWAAALLGCVLILTVGHASEISKRPLLKMYRKMFYQALGAFGNLAWLTGAWEILLHFRMPPEQVTAILGLLVLTISISTWTINSYYEELRDQKRTK